MKRLLLVLLACMAMPASAATYHMLSGIYDVRQNQPAPCTLGICADYALGMRMSGSFTTAAPLAANLAFANISALVTAYNFTDGIHTYASTDPNARNISFTVQTDAGGNVSLALIGVQLWQAAGPHVAGNRFDAITITPDVVEAQTNLSCDVVGPSPAGAPDSCNGDTDDADTSLAVSQFGVTWRTGAPVPVPTAVPSTFTFTSATYETIVNHTTCTIGICADYTPAMRVTATLTTVDRLPPSLADVFLAGYLTSFSFSDGVRTVTSADPDVAFFGAFLDTDASGGIGPNHFLVVGRWQTGGPHAIGDRVDFVGSQSGRAFAITNVACTAIGSSPLALAGPVCVSFDTNDPNTSVASTESVRAWLRAASGPEVAVPTLGEWARIALALLLALAGAIALRASRRR